MRTILAAFFTLAFTSVVYSEYRYEKYYGGEEMKFAYAKNRFVCDEVGIVRTLLVEILKASSPDEARSLIWAPLIEKDGQLVFREIIRTKVPESVRREWDEKCKRAPDKLVIIKADAYAPIDLTNEVVITQLADEDGDKYFTWFLNIEVLPPKPGTPEAARYKKLSR